MNRWRDSQTLESIWTDTAREREIELLVTVAETERERERTRETGGKGRTGGGGGWWEEECRGRKGGKKDGWKMPSVQDPKKTTVSSHP